MTDQEWYDLCTQNWEQVADRLETEGWQRTDHPGKIIPAIFERGERVVYLGRQLGSSEWYTIPLASSEVQ